MSNKPPCTPYNGARPHKIGRHSQLAEETSRRITVVIIAMQTSARVVWSIDEHNRLERSGQQGVPIGAVCAFAAVCPSGRRVAYRPPRSEIRAFSGAECAVCSGPEFALRVARKAVTLAQRIIEMLIGRLITDEQFRSEFIRSPEQILAHLRDRGFDLSRTEVAALVNTDPHLWARTADAIDPRLQKVSLKKEERIP